MEVLTAVKVKEDVSKFGLIFEGNKMDVIFSLADKEIKKVSNEGKSANILRSMKSERIEKIRTLILEAIENGIETKKAEKELPVKEKPVEKKQIPKDVVCKTLSELDSVHRYGVVYQRVNVLGWSKEEAKEKEVRPKRKKDVYKKFDVYEASSGKKAYSGLTIREIAAKLKVSVTTARYYTSTACRRRIANTKEPKSYFALESEE